MVDWASATALVLVQWFNFGGTGLVEPGQALASRWSLCTKFGFEPADHPDILRLNPFFAQLFVSATAKPRASDDLQSVPRLGGSRLEINAYCESETRH